jgi:hypothetical protein
LLIFHGSFSFSSRPYTYIVVLIFYVVGYIIVLTSPTLAAYIVGQVFVSIGSSGLDLLNDIIVADLTTLEWRGFMSSILSAPFLINTWFAGEIVSALSTGDKWRWGYGMFAIIMPVCLGPAIIVLIYLERRAQKQGLVNMASSNAARRAMREAAAEKGQEVPHVSRAVQPTRTWIQAAKANLIEVDAFGLILLGFGWSLFLLPFSLKSTASGGWHNPSMIAMMIVGGLFLIAYVFFERFFAPFPSFPRRLLTNKTFIMAIIIDFFYFGTLILHDIANSTLTMELVCGDLRSLYLSSYTYIVTDWSVQSWTYVTNTLSLSLCAFGLLAGIIQRITHRYKQLQVFGLCVKIIGIGILLNGHRATNAVPAFVMSQILVGMGGAFSVVGSRVSSQASVPHQDVAIVIALLSLWSSIGAAIGAAIAAVIWSNKMPANLRRYLPASVTDAQVKKFYSNIKTIRTYAYDSDIRQGAITAYRQTLWYLIVPAVALAFIPLLASLIQTNYYLGKQQNAVMNVAPDGTMLHDSELHVDNRAAEEPTGPLTFKQKFLRFWANN